MLRDIDVFILGAAKAGTSTLKVCMGEHPDIFVHPQKEFPLFMVGHMYAKGFEHYYQRYFHGAPENSLILAKSAGPMAFPEVIQRIQAHNPRCRVISVLRNPIDRAYSAYWFSRQRGQETSETFEQALAREPSRMRTAASDKDFLNMLRWGYRFVGQYDEQIHNLWNAFGKDRVLVLDFDDLKTDPSRLVGTVFSWLNVAPYIPRPTSVVVNQGRGVKSESVARAFAQIRDPSRFLGRISRTVLPYRVRSAMKERVFRWNQSPLAVPPMSPETREGLVDFFRPFNLQLATLMGNDYGKWDH